MRPLTTAAEVAAFAPNWCLFWGADVARHHFDIWAPYVDRSRFRYVILSGANTIPHEVRERVLAMPNCAVLEPYPVGRRWLRESPRFKGFLHVDTRREIYSVVNAFRSQAHVWVGHGESEKTVYLHRTATLYDAVFVAHPRMVRRVPRAIRRWVSAGACPIGAPIVEGLVKDPWTQPRAVRSVLYAPTWEGTRDSVDYASLPEFGPALLEAMPRLTEADVTVVLRPHPWTGRRLQQRLELVEALFRAGARRGGDKATDLNAADVLISDVSGLTTEFLFTEKPTLLPVSARLAGLGKPEPVLAREYPWAYRFDPAREDLVDRMSGLARDDPLRRRRRGAAKRMFRGHRSLDEAAVTFDLALTVHRWRKAPVEVPLRWVLEVKRLFRRAPRLRRGEPVTWAAD